ncbi:MAG: cobalamin B12-binding domain-containing protein [Elusimicrobiota bacterium]
MNKKIRILLAKPGLDGHDRGIKVIARALRDAGFEVIYTGIRQTPEMIAETSLQENVDCVGLSILSGSHRTLLPLVVKELNKRGLRKVSVFAGGIIPESDFAFLRKAGIRKIFGPGTKINEIIGFIKAGER